MTSSPRRGGLTASAATFQSCTDYVTSCKRQLPSLIDVRAVPGCLCYFIHAQGTPGDMVDTVVDTDTDMVDMVDTEEEGATTTAVGGEEVTMEEEEEGGGGRAPLEEVLLLRLNCIRQQCY